MKFDFFRVIGCFIIRLIDYLFYCWYKIANASRNFRGKEEDYAVGAFVVTILIPIFGNIMLVLWKLDLFNSMDFHENVPLIISYVVFFAICYFGVEKIYFDEGRYIEIMKRFREKRVIIWYLSVLGWMFGFTLIGALISIL
ncbi:MAG: hypothetical protein IJE73_02235 [Muribaculaceae bacterium]|nr:hypothetical protein [Muribaculaceae bacterium]